MSLASKFKNLLRRPSGESRDETASQPNQIIARRPARPSSDLFQPVMPDTSAQMDLPMINPRPPQRPMPLPGGDILERTLSGAPLQNDDAQPFNEAPQPIVRARRPSEMTLEEINALEGTKAVNEDKGFKAKGWDVAKNALKGFLQGVGNSGGDLMGGLGGAIAGAGVQLADPATDEKNKRKKRLGELYGIYDRQNKTETDQEKIRREQANTDNISADNQRDRDRLKLQEKQYDLSVEKALDKRDFDEWKMKNGDAKLSDYQAYNKWRMELGDKKQASENEYRNWKREADKASLKLRERGLDIQEKIGLGNLNVRQGQLDLSRQNRAEQTKQYLQRNNLSVQQFKAQLAEKVAAGKLTQVQADEMLRDAQ